MDDDNLPGEKPKEIELLNYLGEFEKLVEPLPELKSQQPDSNPPAKKELTKEHFLFLKIERDIDRIPLFKDGELQDLSGILYFKARAYGVERHPEYRQAEDRILSAKLNNELWTPAETAASKAEDWSSLQGKQRKARAEEEAIKILMQDPRVKKLAKWTDQNSPPPDYYGELESMRFTRTLKNAKSADGDHLLGHFIGALIKESRQVFDVWFKREFDALLEEGIKRITEGEDPEKVIPDSIEKLEEKLGKTLGHAFKREQQTAIPELIEKLIAVYESR